MSRSAVAEADATPAAGALRGALGAPGARLLAGPSDPVPESFASHLQRLDDLALDDVTPASLIDLVDRAGLLGRGGGEFPLARKLQMAAASPQRPLVVVNASEGEPASRKDRLLLAARPHLVLDGAEVAARAVGTDDVVVYLHRGRRTATAALEAAIEERGPRGVHVRLVDAPDRYVAGETTAVVSYLEGKGALPRRRAVPAAAHGVAGRPTVVSNAETIAHLALLARRGAAWFRLAGDERAPGSTLVTLAGDVAAPGTVVEALGTETLEEVLVTHAGRVEPPQAVLLGGYGSGTWVPGAAVTRARLSRGTLSALGAPLGCGVVVALGHDACGIRTVANLAAWLALASSGQCGPCALGLPRLAELLCDLADGFGGRSSPRRVQLLTASVRGRGGCGHPSGVAQMVDTALSVFAADVASHARGRPCRRPALRLPLPEGRA